MPGVKRMHVSDDEINKLVDEQEPWEVVKSVPGILKTHCIVCEKKDHVKLYTDDLKDCLVAAVKYCDDNDEEVECVADVEIEGMKEGDWVVVVVYNSKCYPGQVTKVASDESLKVNVMRPCFPSGWKWPITKDEIFYKKESLVKKINPPFQTDARGGRQFIDSILKDL